jgi:hypothetical protein
MAVGYEIADVAKFSGADKREIIFLADNGALKPDPTSEHGGSGVRRVFAAQEIFVAAVLKAAKDRKIAIGELIQIATLFRAVVSTGGFKDIIMDTAEGKGTNLLICDKNKVNFWSPRIGEDLASKLTGSAKVVIDLNVCLRPVLIQVFKA